MSTAAPSAIPAVIWTIGHSLRAIDEFLSLLARPEIEVIVDVRSFPGSRRSPQYGREVLKETLAAHSIGYHWLPALGGRRKASPDSPNTVWRNTSFRGYADHMSTLEFARGLEQLLQISVKARTALVCSEAVWWRCHRSMIADALSVRGIEVVHILDSKHSVVHPMTAPARVVAGALSYAAMEPEKTPTGHLLA
jgi:uncharacterized protein (DUF488 family)